MNGDAMAKNFKRATEYQGKRKSRVVVVICIVLAALFLIWSAAGSFMYLYASAASPAAGPDDMKGVWVATVSNIDYPKHPTTDPEALREEIDGIVENCATMGLNTIFFQVRSNADAFYPSSLFPWSRDLTGKQGLAPADGFDPLAYFTEAAHRAGLELHAWINPFRITVGGESQWASMTEDHPAKNEYSQYVVKYKNNYYFDPSSPEVRELIVAGALEILDNYDVDGIHLDDYFYPGKEFDDVSAYEASGTGLDLYDWRRDNVDQLIRTLDQYIHEYDPDCRFGVSPSGIWANRSTDERGSATRGYQHYINCAADSYKWIKNGWIDYVVPQIYWPIGYSIADYEILANWWNNVVEDTDVDLYIGMADYRVNESSSAKLGFDPDEIMRELILNRSLPNAGGEIHFSYRDLLESGLPELYEEVYRPETYFADHSYFKDMIGHWAQSAAEQLYDMGVISGTDYRVFEPEQYTTRAQFVKMLAGTVGAVSGIETSETGFSDVPADAWYAPYVAWAAEAGIALGYGDEENRFGPQDPVTREQVAALLTRYLGLSGITPSFIREMTDFEDAGRISEWAEEYVVFAVRSGLFQGTRIEDADGAVRYYFNPADRAVRAQTAAVMCNLHSILAEQDGR